MAENDIYNTKRKYENFIKAYKEFGKKPKDRDYSDRSRNRSKYWCKNTVNLDYFLRLAKHFAAKDLSYIRRMRLIGTFKIICHIAKKDLKDCDRDDVNEIVAFMHKNHPSIKSKGDFIIDIKYLWKILIPEKDEKGRIDDTIVPYAVRHLSGKIDKSKEKKRDDKLSVQEFESLIKAFSQDARIQAYLTLAFESLGRPQEILYTKIKDVELQDNYGKIWISEHGKEGTGFLEVIDSYPYIAKWYNQHPLRNDPNAFFFINLGNLGKYEQLKPTTINKHLRQKMNLLGIKKPVTCYSLKRSGVTYRRLRGDSDVQIQRAARWISTKQLNTYDLSQHDDTFKIELVKRGIIKDEKYKQYQTTTKKCLYCDTKNGISDDLCNNCKRPLDRKKIVAEMQDKDEKIDRLEKQITDMPKLILDMLKQKESSLEKLKSKI